MVGYTEAGVALILCGVLILYVDRLKTSRAFQKRVLIFSTGLLIAAILSNVVISSVLQATSPLDWLVHTKKVQAVFDHLLGLSIGAFVIATVTPGIRTASDLLAYVRERRPVSYIGYNAVFIAGIAAVVATQVNVVVLPGGGYAFSFPLWFLAVLALVSTSFVVFVTYKLIAHLRAIGSKRNVARQTYLMLLGLNGYTVAELVFEILLPAVQVDVRGLGFLVEILLIGLVAYTLSEPSFLQQLPAPRSEADRETDKKFFLEGGSSYLVIEEKPDHAFDIFTDLVTHGVQGLCITRTSPQKVARDFGLERTPILWLSRVVNKDNCLRPSPPENIALAIEHFVSEGDRCVVLIDGLEYLIAHNDFSSILALLHDMIESIALHESILIIPLDPQTLEAQQFALIKRELVPIHSPQVKDFLAGQDEQMVDFLPKSDGAESDLEMEA